MAVEIIILGSKPGAVVALAKMLSLGWDIKYVVVPKKYDADWIEGVTLEKYALSKNLNVLYNQKDLPGNCKVDFVISYMYRSLVKTRTINMAKVAALNFHAGPLPSFGGWAFYNVAILENAEEYGCTCHYMDDSFDTGPLLKVSRFPIKASLETAVSLEKKTQKQMISLFSEFCKMVEDGESLLKVEQNKSEMRYLDAESFKRLKEIPADADDETIDRYARAFWYPPYECAYSFINGHKVEIVPEVVKWELAHYIHQSDLSGLLETINVHL